MASPAQIGMSFDELTHDRRDAGRTKAVADRTTDDLTRKAAEFAAATQLAGAVQRKDATQAAEPGEVGGDAVAGVAGEAGGDVGVADEAGGDPVAGPAVGAGGAGRNGLLAGVLVGEPPVGDGVAVVYRRAEKLRRRRVRKVVAAGLVSAAVVAAFGYALATAAIPAPLRLRKEAAAPVAGPAPAVDAVKVALGPVLRDNGLRAVAREPGSGPGWRQYAVVNVTSGRPAGLIEVAVYAAPDGLCFPLLSDREACARPMSDGGDMEYARYTDVRDVDWQVQEAIARRRSDGRVVAVMATGERGTGLRADGRPPLTAAQVAGVAVDVRVMSAFAPDEDCTGPDAACPVLKVAVPKSR